MADARVDPLLARRAELATSGTDASVTAMLLFQVARTLLRHPRLNATLDGDGIVAYDVVNINVAVAVADGLRVPVIRGAERLSLEAIVERLSDLTARARENRLAPADSADGTFTVSDLGRSAVRSFVPIVNPPQSAILGIGAMQTAYAPGPDDAPRLQRQVTLTVSADHRVVDGADAAAFLTDMVAVIEAAEFAEPEWSS